MMEKDEKIPDPKEIEKEISEFLSEKFGGRVKLITPVVLPQEASFEKEKEEEARTKKKINFSLKPEELEAYLDQYIVKQDEAKAILATKICTHFNRIKHTESSGKNNNGIVGHIKNNILMVGPTGVGKTYMIKLIAQKIGVPFIKGDATKFSETGYVGGDVEDLVRDLVREADDDIELAQYGIIYIDEIDKIASSPNLMGPDVSRTGVQRALLKPMEETDVDLKVPHDPISMLEEIERYRKTGKKKKRVVNTKNILFIMSGAFHELAELIKKRIGDQGIGFGGSVTSRSECVDYLKHVKPEDLIKFGFETEFIGRLPVISVFEHLNEEDLYAILKNPNNPVILSKKFDFNAYDISIKFEDQALRALAHLASTEQTGARGLVSVIEKVLLKFEKKLPSTDIKKLPVTQEVIKDPEGMLQEIISTPNDPKWTQLYEKLLQEEKEWIKQYINNNLAMVTEKSKFAMTPSRIDLIADAYTMNTCDVNGVMAKIQTYYEQVKKVEAYFHKTHDLNIVMDEDAIDVIIRQMISSPTALGDFYKQLTTKFEYGFRLIRDRVGQNNFVITKEALENPEAFFNTLVKKIYAENPES
ncbi:MAG: AAA family ATPase [Deltaproteobacteria bacterium]|nr:AAA family ATPase [Deltaproteobacteria bacterium]MBW2019783.1 AAA family ATPase [Deltaproteobacteria bacterium]MBW2074663.1 AAA family ATPase [Deltaproteobacteria bacterium]RLB83481.1 MAG: ATPase [Deltaproteobacteria bacterium]